MRKFLERLTNLPEDMALVMIADLDLELQLSVFRAHNHLYHRV